MQHNQHNTERDSTTSLRLCLCVCLCLCLCVCVCMRASLSLSQPSTHLYARVQEQSFSKLPLCHSTQATNSTQNRQTNKAKQKRGGLESKQNKNQCGCCPASPLAHPFSPPVPLALSPHRDALEERGDVITAVAWPPPCLPVLSSQPKHAPAKVALFPRNTHACVQGRGKAGVQRKRR